jgi:hypothetical protein
MSVGVGIWKDALVSPVHTELRENADPEVASLGLTADDPIISLVRQLFFSVASNQRRRVLFTAAGAETNIHAFCERIGKALSNISGATVAVMHSSGNSLPRVSGKKHPDRVRRDVALKDRVQISERLWRIPTSLFSELRSNAEQIKTELPFHYVLFSSAVSDSVTPLFCCACDGAVLVLTANQTRRGSALRAMEVLRQCRTEVLGTVLSDRKFPIPESIYRRL